MKNKLCIKCNEYPVHIKVRGLCKKCYSKLHKEGQLKVLLPGQNVSFDREMEFAKNYFEGDYVYQPITFNLKSTSYRPDFWDIKNNTFIELISTRQAYHLNKRKYMLFRYLYPKLEFKIVTPDGKTLNEVPNNKNLKWETLSKYQVISESNTDK